MPILSSLAVACARAYGFTALSGGFVTVIQSFTATGEWVCPTGVTEVEWLIVAGGGGGGFAVWCYRSRWRSGWI
jgi:hypothetical protein